jgi:hypothetical protein
MAELMGQVKNISGCLDVLISLVYAGEISRKMLIILLHVEKQDH